MNGKRDFSIDFFKGITVISIIFIHTVWWSGEAYVPNIIAQFSLLIDVPLFFFLSGASATFSFNKKNVFGGVLRLLGLFAFFFGIYAILFPPENTLNFIVNSLVFQFPWAKDAPVVSGSTWFIAVFGVVYLLGYLIIHHVGSNKVLPIICALLLYFMYNYEAVNIFHQFKILSITPDFVFSYLFFFLFGYFYYSKLRLYKKIKFYAAGLFLIALALVLFHFKGIPFNLQSIKFPPRFYYVVASLISISLVMFFSSFIKKEYFINYSGKNALPFYLAQGIGGSVLLFILPEIHLNWPIKLAIALLINLFTTVVLAVTIAYFYKHFLLNLTKFLFFIDNFSFFTLKDNIKSLLKKK